MKRAERMGAVDPASLTSLARSYRQPLLRFFARRTLSPEAAEDCVQEVFMRLARASEPGVENSEAYLFKTARHVLIDRARRATVRREILHDPIADLQLVSPEGSPSRILEGREALEQAARALRELPERTRNIFLLNRLDGLTYTQLAARYAVNVKVIEREMSKALSHLRRRLPDHDRR
ncbi:RNA polymerase sigma factor [Caulobacter sp. X]|uniref:RNA polymerase sigma factor n=1 Tax=Caulobacter sp. X TaxID=2048901 RepID=UPI000C15D2B7|nr:sigma-70 family RNA polymerase sigma factor [Caulobacter sp. X]PIC00545.1 RNA polymerase subunit sigma-24 [Caulobacter sp. X]